jgi:hypothetical protein
MRFTRILINVLSRLIAFDNVDATRTGFAIQIISFDACRRKTARLSAITIGPTFDVLTVKTVHATVQNTVCFTFTIIYVLVFVTLDQRFARAIF